MLNSNNSSNSNISSSQQAAYGCSTRYATRELKVAVMPGQPMNFPPGMTPQQQQQVLAQRAQMAAAQQKDGEDQEQWAMMAR